MTGKSKVLGDEAAERRLLSAVADGISKELIASRFQCSVSTIAQVMRKHGVALRPSTNPSGLRKSV